MSFWSWFLIWTLLTLSSLIALGLIIKSLLNRGELVVRQAKRLTPKISALTEAIETKPIVEKPKSAITEDPRRLIAVRNRLLAAKAKKVQARQRRLIASLKAFKPEESRFH